MENYRYDQRNGLSRIYNYFNGKLLVEAQFVNDQLEGVRKQFFEDGILEEIAHYKNNLRDGITKQYYRNGKIKNEIVYKDDKLLFERQYDLKGQPLF